MCDNGIITNYNVIKSGPFSQSEWQIEAYCGRETNTLLRYTVVYKPFTVRVTKKNGLFFSNVNSILLLIKFITLTMRAFNRVHSDVCKHLWYWGLKLCNSAKSRCITLIIMSDWKDCLWQTCMWHSRLHVLL